MLKKWRIKPYSGERTAELAAKLGISQLLAGALINRGIDTREKGEIFLHPERFEYCDPYLLPDMDKAIERIRLVEPYIILREKGEILRLNLRNILYVEVFSHSCVIHTTSGLIEQKVSITELENSFGEQFVRVHRSYLVNLERVKQIGKTEIVLENDEIVPLSRRKYNEVNLAFIRYFKGKI